MDWRCEWCGKPHEENDPPCDNCGHGSFEKAVTQVNEEVVEGGPVWVCQDCGREHMKNSPPCKRCGGSDFERRVGPPETDPLDEIKTGWLDVLEAKYVVGYVAVALLLGLILLSVVGGGVPGVGGQTATGPPEIPAAPGSASTADGLELAATEDAYFTVLNDRREAAGSDSLTRSVTADNAAAYYNKAIVADRYGDGDPPSREALDRFGLDCDRTYVVAYQVAYDRTPRSVGDFDDESALATALVDSYLERGSPFRPADAGLVGVDIHVAPDGRVFVTHLVC